MKKIIKNINKKEIKSRKRIIKRFLLIPFSLSLILTSCLSTSSYQILSENKFNQNNIDSIEETYKPSLARFSKYLYSDSYQLFNSSTSDNILYSPLAGLLNFIILDETSSFIKNEIYQHYGIIDSNDAYTSYQNIMQTVNFEIKNDKNQVISQASSSFSLFLKNIPDFNLSLLEDLAKDYYLNSYFVKDDLSLNQAINYSLKKDLNLSLNIDDKTIRNYSLFLLSSIYFKDSYLTYANRVYDSALTFKNRNNNEVNTDFFYIYNKDFIFYNQYIEANAIAYRINLSSSNLTFILPSEGFTIDDIILENIDLNLPFLVTNINQAGYQFILPALNLNSSNTIAPFSDLFTLLNLNDSSKFNEITNLNNEEKIFNQENILRLDSYGINGNFSLNNNLNNEDNNSNDSAEVSKIIIDQPFYLFINIEQLPLYSIKILNL